MLRACVSHHEDLQLVINVESGQCRGDVRPWLATGKVWRGADGSFYVLWVRGDGWRSSSGKRENRLQLLTGLYRDLQQNHDTVDRVTGGRKWGNIHWWAWCEWHSDSGAGTPSYLGYRLGKMTLPSPSSSDWNFNPEWMPGLNPTNIL